MFLLNGFCSCCVAWECKILFKEGVGRYCWEWVSRTPDLLPRYPWGQVCKVLLIVGSGGFDSLFSFLLSNLTTAVCPQTKSLVLISLPRCPSTRFFSTVFPQPITLSPGMSLTLPIVFRPTEKVKWQHQNCSQCSGWLPGGRWASATLVVSDLFSLE